MFYDYINKYVKVVLIAKPKTTKTGSEFKARQSSCPMWPYLMNPYTYVCIERRLKPEQIRPGV